MKKSILKYALVLGVFFFLPFFVKADETVNMYFFYGDGCPHCAKEEIFLDRLEKENEMVNVERSETWRNRDNANLLKEVSQKLNIKVTGVPVLIIGDEAIIGYYSDETTGLEIRSVVNKYIETGCEDEVKAFVDNTYQVNECEYDCSGEKECEHDCDCKADIIKIDNSNKSITLPFLGEIDIKNFSLPVLTFVIAATDGFNPCAMWVLLFLISLLLGMKDKKRMWILGMAFIVSSGLVYFFFLSAWLNLFLFLGFVFWIRVTIGVVALLSGSYHLKEAWDNRDGCKVIKGGKRKKIFEKLRNVVNEKSFFLAFGGIVLLAVAVNFVELVCSAGLPAVYTQVLSASSLPPWQYYTYLVFYVVIFMLDDMLIFFIAMKTLKMKGLSSKYTQWAQWIGGIVMLILGILLIFKPGWVMFG